MAGARRLKEPLKGSGGIRRHTTAVQQDLAIEDLGLDDTAPGLGAQPGGDAIGGNLAVTHAQAGSIEGSVTLSPAQVEALNHQALYIRIDSEKAPDGNLQGWLEGK